MKWDSSNASGARWAGGGGLAPWPTGQYSTPFEVSLELFQDQ